MKRLGTCLWFWIKNGTGRVREFQGRYSSNYSCTATRLIWSLDLKERNNFPGDYSKMSSKMLSMREGEAQKCYNLIKVRIKVWNLWLMILLYSELRRTYPCLYKIWWLLAINLTLTLIISLSKTMHTLSEIWIWETLTSIKSKR